MSHRITPQKSCSVRQEVGLTKKTAEEAAAWLVAWQRFRRHEQASKKLVETSKLMSVWKATKTRSK